MWLEAAKRLPLGHKVRLQHDCGEDKSMIVSHNENGYIANCFRCGNVGFEGHGYRNLAEIQRVRELNEQTLKESNTNELPKDFSTTIPTGNTLWLARAGINNTRYSSCGIGWSARLQRIVIPVYNKNSLVYWQARAVIKGQIPKYTNPPTSKTEVIYWVDPPTGRTDQVVVTEDILSAIRVGKHVTAASILGTKTSDSQAAQLSGFDEVTYWLDPDAAGIEGNRKGVRKLSLVTKATSMISDVDPKNLSDRCIRDLLGLKPNHRYTYYE
jgi:DNA primase